MSEKGGPVQGSSSSSSSRAYPKPSGGWPLVFYYLGDTMYSLYLKVKDEFPNLDPFLSGIFGGGVVAGVKSTYEAGFGSKRKDKEESQRRYQEFLSLVQAVETRLSTDLKTGLIETNSDLKTGLVETNSEIKILRENMSFKFEQQQKQFEQQQTQMQQIQNQQFQQYQQQQLPPPPPEFRQSSFFPSLPKQQQIRIGTFVLNGISRIFRK